jgi:glutathione S-transferase
MFAQSDPERAAKARQRFGLAAEAVARALGDEILVVAGRFGVADILVGTALAFTARAGFAEELPSSLKDFTERLAQRPAYLRAVERTTSSVRSA